MPWLTPGQAMYQFISGYTAKVAGTEVGITEPEPNFSACYGAAFLSLHPTVYAELLAKKIREHDVDVWLVNTGWTGGSYGVGKRFDLAYTRAIIDAILGGGLGGSNFERDDVFGLAIPLISVHMGFRTRGGAEGVGRTTTQAVMFMTLTILILDAMFPPLLLN